MFLKIKRAYERNKCTVFFIREEHFFSGQDYEVRIFTTNPRKKVPKGGELEELSKSIVRADKIPTAKEDYPLKVVLKDYEHVTILLKKIKTIKNDTSRN